MTAPEEYTVPVTVHLPAPMWKRLAVVAREHETTVGALLVEVLRRALTGSLAQGGAVGPTKSRRAVKRWGPIEDEVLIQLHGKGMSDNAIAKVIGVSNTKVSARRIELGLAPLFTGRPRKGPTS